MTEEKKILQVGLVMPISPIDGCSAEHWSEVNAILVESLQNLSQYKCDVKIVSLADDVGVIQKRIVQNIYSADIIICDVSCKNANVMFELGMRLAFDKPTVIIKDEITDYSFDTGIIEHIEYPRDLRFSKVVEFKSKLSRKVIATYEESLRNPEHSTFLKNFGEFKVATLEQTSVSPDNLILEMLLEIQRDVATLKRDRKRDISRVIDSGNIRGISNLSKETRASFIDAVKHGIKLYSNLNDLTIHQIASEDFNKSHLYSFLDEHVRRTLSYSPSAQTLADTASHATMELLEF